MSDDGRLDPIEHPHRDEPEAFAQTRTDASGGRRKALAPTCPAGLRPGDVIGRYVVVNELGRGGTGVVVKAYDSDLDRAVAIKILHPGVELGSQGAGARLVREGQAIAQLSHENVVSVYDVGLIGSEVFIAMEYVSGETLTTWMRAEGRSVREIVRVFLQAGRGLMAAHRKGLIHRDFKPHNVLIGDDGRVKVLDFGLARSFGDLDADELHMITSQIARSTQLCETITRTGFIVGTPAYMAPEQHRAGVVDARTDQFSFCVALYEALYGERPFSGGTYRELCESVLERPVVVAPRDGRVPGWLRQVLDRGLRGDPGERFPSMEELLRALSYDDGAARSRTRRWVGAGVGFAALAALAVIGFTRDAPVAAVDCESAGQEATLVWNEDVARDLRDAFAGVDVPYANASRERVSARLSDYGQRWQRMRRDVCEATHVRGLQSSELLDVRMACLDRRVSEMKALVSVLLRPDESVVEQAVHSANALVALEECAALTADDRPYPEPTDALTRARIREQSSRLDQAKVLQQARRYREGSDIAEEVLVAARELGHPPLLADALIQAAELDLDHSQRPNSHSLTRLREAVELAASIGDDRLEARAWTLLAGWTIGSRGNEDQHFALLAAKAAVARSGDEGELRAALHDGMGISAMGDQKYEAAEHEFRRALAIREALFGAEDLRVADSVSYVSYALLSQDRDDEARALVRRARSIYLAQLGPDHPLLNTTPTADVPTATGRGYQVASRYGFESPDILTAAASRVRTERGGRWFLGGRGYHSELVTDEKRSGQRSAHLAFREEGSFGVATRGFPVEEARGKWIRLSGYIKTANIDKGHAGLWLRVDGPGDRTLAFDNMAARGVQGTTGWTQYFVELPVAPEAVQIWFGALLSENGEAWIDDLAIEISSEPLPSEAAPKL